MSQSLWEPDPDYGWHLLGGGVIEAGALWRFDAAEWPRAVILILGAVLVLVLAVAGYGREKWQHRDHEKLTAHQLAEAWLWPAGGTLVLVGYWLAFS